MLWLGGAVITAALVPQELRLLKNHQFVELQHRLILKNKVEQATLVERLSRYHSSCFKLTQGVGKRRSLIECMTYVNTKKELAKSLAVPHSLTQDLDTLCTQYAKEVGFMKDILLSRVLLSAHWNRCRTAVWQQVYLTAYANFESDPARCISLIRKAERSILRDSHWTPRVMKLMQDLR